MVAKVYIILKVCMMEIMLREFNDKKSNFKQIRVSLGICYEKFDNFDYIKK